MERTRKIVLSFYRKLALFFTAERSVVILSVAQAMCSLALLIWVAARPLHDSFRTPTDHWAFYALCFAFSASGVSLPYVPQLKRITLTYMATLLTLLCLGVGGFWIASHLLEVKSNECRIAGSDCTGILSQMELSRWRCFTMPVLHGLVLHPVVTLSIGTVGRKLGGADFAKVFCCARKKVRFTRGG